MDLLIPNSWLKKFLNTKAIPSEIAKYLSLCGPSIEKTTKTNDGDFIYSIEVTTNRVDSASVLGIAREAQTILPRFGIPAKLKDPTISRGVKYNPPPRWNFVKKVKYLDAIVDSKLCPRFTAVLIKDVVVKDSPKKIASLLEKVEVRPINNIVDVSNYIMHELGQPIHTFDYDKIVNSKMILRESVKGEKVTTLDGKNFTLPGGDIVIEDGSGKLIDLCGIMGGENSAIDANTKNVLLFVQVYDRHRIRKTSMTLAQRSEAAVLFEKGLDTELVKPAIISALDMIQKLSGGKSENKILDIYPTPYREKTVTTNLEELEKIIGIKLNKKDVTEYLTSLGFKTLWNKNILKVQVPSFRANDINIPEDIAEEVARIYGYHNLPNTLMSGDLPRPVINESIKLEKNIKQILKSLGAIEVLNLSLVDKDTAGDNALKLKNPLGSDTEHLRTSLMPLLIRDVKDNPQEKENVHFFELSNIYVPRKNDLPEEILMLAGIIRNNNYRENKGTVESILDEIGIDYKTEVQDGKNYLANQRTVVYSGKVSVGKYGNLENGLFYYEFSIDKLTNGKKLIRKYKEVAKYPPQIEDITFVFPPKTMIGDVVSLITNNYSLITNVELRDVFKDSYTFRIWYQDETKTLTDIEVEKIRNKILAEVKNKFGGVVKD